MAALNGSRIPVIEQILSTFNQLRASREIMRLIQSIAQHFRDNENQNCPAQSAAK